MFALDPFHWRIIIRQSGPPFRLLEGRPAGGRRTDATIHPAIVVRPSVARRCETRTREPRDKAKKKELNAYLRHDVPLAHGDDGHRHAQPIIGEDLRHARLGPERADARVEARARRRRRRRATRGRRGRFHAKLRGERGRREGHHHLFGASFCAAAGGRDVALMEHTEREREVFSPRCVAPRVHFS